MNVLAEAGHVLSLIELHEHLNSSHFPAILNDGVVGCGGGNGDAEHVPQQFHCKEGFLDRCGECEQIFMLLCVRCSLLGNAGIDLVGLDINEVGMRLSLRITSWSEAGERLGSRVTSWSGKTCTAGTDSAHRRVCPGVSAGWYGCFCTAPSVQHRTGRMGRSWSSLSSPLVQGQDCCWRGPRDQEKFRNGAPPFKEQQKRATVLRMDLLSKRLPEVATTGDASGSTARGDRTSAGAADAPAIDHRCEQSDTNSSCPGQPDETWLISELETSRRRSRVKRVSG